MDLQDAYLEKVRNLIDSISLKEKEKISVAGKKVAENTAAGGIVHLFGSGHSILSALEVYIRAGAFSNSKPVIKELEMDKFERIPGVGLALMKSNDGLPGEVMIVFSNSGKNPLPVEIAESAKEKGLYTIGISSFEHAEKTREGSKLLMDIVDLAIDSHVPYGDASVEIPGTKLKTGPLSSLANVMILHSIYCRAVEYMMEMNEMPPVRISRNTPEGDEYNRKYADKYGKRIPDLRY